MTPKEKAKELYDKFYAFTLYRISKKNRIKDAKQCALICVDQAILYHPYPVNPEEWGIKFHLFWEQVRTEINML